MPDVFDVSDPDQLLAGVRSARMAIARKQVVVIPTETSYALVADAFSPAAIALMREVKGWVKAVPPQVLMPGIATLHALADQVEPPVDTLATELWPGPLTLIVPAGESLTWDLGDNKGTVALRIPRDPITRELLADTGPLAATQATPVGRAIAHDPAAIQDAFSDLVAVYLTRGVLDVAEVSTVVDATGLAFPEGRLRIVRQGAIAVSVLHSLVGPDLFHPVDSAESQAGD
jgi:L-threonylcarbamoyladenylate synthase